MSDTVPPPGGTNPPPPDPTSAPAPAFPPAFSSPAFPAAVSPAPGQPAYGQPSYAPSPFGPQQQQPEQPGQPAYGQPSYAPSPFGPPQPQPQQPGQAGQPGFPPPGQGYPQPGYPPAPGHPQPGVPAGYPQSGMPGGYPQPGMAAGYPQPGAPAPKRRSVLKIVLMAVALGGILLVGLGIFGVSAIVSAAADPAKGAQVGDCLAASSSVADVGTTETSAEVVECGSVRAEYTVVARVEGESSPNSTACEKFFPGDEKYYVYGSTADGGYVLCLRPKG
ncbi:hypothetical protein JIG36_49185 [Actinoplanes sp. LDG1-06]|uniref:Uncharacterized protein n=1 Tax=Paractinoplanes ovalisporus TaxID=2810368 RepID=A0ABS2AWA3_9ACTN|nr:hypothetical protein [Actinoplanes ovalisporus]MBM2623496.1 hypothetical protein [Actinoplanes ovalisporus]